MWQCRYIFLGIWESVILAFIEGPMLNQHEDTALPVSLLVLGRSSARSIGNRQESRAEVGSVRKLPSRAPIGICDWGYSSGYGVG